jgi:hypothetical protein
MLLKRYQQLIKINFIENIKRRWNKKSNRVLLLAQTTARLNPVIAQKDPGFRLAPDLSGRGHHEIKKS